jgi:hypothetical protein
MVKKHHIPFTIRFFDQSFPSFVIAKTHGFPAVCPSFISPWDWHRFPKELVQGSGPANGWVTPNLRGKEPTVGASVAL